MAGSVMAAGREVGSGDESDVGGETIVYESRDVERVLPVPIA